LKTRLSSLAPLAALPVLAHAPMALAQEPAGPGAGAQEEAGHEELRLPIAEAERPITLPAHILSPEIDFDITRSNGGTYANLALVGAYGLTDELGIRATVLPLQLAAPGPNPFRYGQPTENVGPSVGATYRLSAGHVEFGASLDVAVSTIPNSSGIIFTPGIPVRFHVGKQIRVDTGLYIPINRLATTTTTQSFPAQSTPSDAATTTAGFDVPLSFLYDVTEPLHVGVSTAFTVADDSQWSNTATIPVSFFTGYAVAGKEGPILDIDPFFTFPQLLTPGEASTTHAADYMIGLSLAAYLYL
jgi:hypothetical protein